MAKKGLFIVFEGGEGAGKSMQVGLLASRLREAGHEVVATREPGGTRIGEQIRAITHNPENVDLSARAEAYLMAASRAQHVNEIIEPALIDGKIVVCDRFLDSSIAYQGYGRKLGADTIGKLNEMAVKGLVPDLTILLDVPIDVGLARRNGSVKKDRLDLQQKSFYERVYRGYLELAKKNPTRYVVIGGTDAIDAVAGKIWETVKRFVDTRNGKT